MTEFLTRTRLLVGFFAVCAVVVGAAISSGVVALRNAPKPDSPVTIRANGDTPELEKEGVTVNPYPPPKRD